MTEPEPLHFVGLNQVRLRQRTLAYFSGCDYFRLARDPRVAQAMMVSLRAHGLNVAASRRTTGNHAIYAQLEAALADFFAVESALLVPDGYFAPMAAAQALAGGTTRVFIDALAHGAMLDAARMFSCPVTAFPHRDADALARLLRPCSPSERVLVMTDGMFSHDGSVAPLRAYLKVLPSGGRILVDDAHGAGTLGATGRGSLELAGVSRRRIIQCATLSKAFGVYGGVILASRALRRQMLARSRVFAGTTPLPPPLAGAALMALNILRREPVRRQRLVANVKFVRSGLRAAGWELTDTPGPIVRLPALSVARTRELKSRLLAVGIYPPWLKYGAAARQGFFRFVISSEHTREQLSQVIAVLTPGPRTATPK
jgi:7-keto-8-aminopelargonate synthetase-like enzyme